MKLRCYGTGLVAGATGSSAAWAQTDDLPLAAMGGFDGDKSLSFWVILAVVLVVLALWTAVTGAQAPTRDARVQLQPPRLRHLFLGVRFHALPAAASAAAARVPETPCLTAQWTGHILALDLRSAVLVTSEAVGKGERLRLSLDSLPGFPASGAAVDAVVSGCRHLHGQPDSYVLKVRFASAGPDWRAPLGSYLHSLASSSRLSHA